MRAFGELSRDDKIRYYNKNVTYVVRINSGITKSPKITEEMLEGVCYTRSYSIKRWKKKTIRLDMLGQVLVA